VLDFLGDDTESKSLGFQRGFLLTITVYGHTGQFGNVRDPAAIRLAKQPYGELHIASSYQKRGQPEA